VNTNHHHPHLATQMCAKSSDWRRPNISSQFAQQ